MKEVFIVDAIRTPIGKFGKALARFSPVELGAFAIKAIVERNKVEKNKVDIVIMGHVIRDGTGMDTARQASIHAGIPKDIDAMTVDMVCASGMAAIMNAASLIKSGNANMIIAGGMESMSRSPFVIPWEYRWGVKLLYGRTTPIIDSLVYEGLTDPFINKIMAEEADMLAKEKKVSRERLEEIALESNLRADQATKKGYFKSEITPITLDENIVLDYDEGIRGDTSLEKMARLPPIFPGGVHTAATSSQISDGASALLIADEDAVSKYNWKPRAKIIGYTWAAVDTWRFPEAPIYAVKKLLEKTGYTLNEIDVFENNEAFALSTALYEDMLGVSRDKVNLFGGAIALGHPLGASGARITTTLLNVMEHKNLKRGIASICHGTGGGTAILIEKI